jgi:hypothetical protein
MFFATEELQLVDTSADVLRLNVLASLDELSNRTGGFLTAETNDLRPAMDRIDLDISNIYEISYIPSDLQYDGSFRKIEVNVLRPDVKIQSRDGYFALPPDAENILLPYEVPLLRELESAKPRKDLALFQGAFGFGYSDDRRELALALEIPLRDLDFEMDKEDGLMKAHFSLLMLLKNDSGQVIEKFSRDFPVCGPPDRFEKIRDSSVTFLQDADLRPGEYTIEGAILDHGSKQLGTVRDRVIVEPRPAGLDLSHIVIADHTRPLDPGEEFDDPLRFRDSIIVPSLSHEIQKGRFPNVIFFMNVYTNPDVGQIPRLDLEVTRKKKRFALLQPNLPSPDPSGVISFAIGLPTKEFEPGEYQVRVEAVQGESYTERSTTFRIKEEN